MKIALITTYPQAEEVERLRNEAILLGHRFKLIDFGEFGFSIKDNKLLIKGISDLDADLVIIRGVFTGIHNLAPLIELLRSRDIKVFDNNASIHKYAINKVVDFMELSLSHLPIPDTFYSRDFPGFNGAAEELGYPVVVKSIRMGKGASVVKFSGKGELDKYLEEYQRKGGKAKDIVMQKFVDYRYDLRIFVFGEKLFSMRRIPPKNDFRANFSLGGTVELFELPENLKDLALKAIKAVKLEIAGVDILVDKNGKHYVLEVNHTPGMLGIEKATNENISRMYLEYAIKKAK